MEEEQVLTLPRDGIAQRASTTRRVLVIDDDATARRTLERFLTREGFSVTTAANANEGLLAVQVDQPEIILSDIYMPGMSGLELQAKIQEFAPHINILLMTGQDDMPTTVKAMQQGAYDYLTKPIDLERLKKILTRLIETQQLSEQLELLKKTEAEEYKLENILVGRSRQMLDIYKTIGSVTRSRVTVLIEGESGTGKELIARAVHFNSPWKDEPFIAVNCTALAETLLESELFGHMKGSFTGATADKRGKFELARGGTIFLDEIGEISPTLQVKLLRVLQEREFERVGGEKTLPMSARIIAATNRDLKKEVDEGRFREDLYYRLNVVSIKAPPLRERKEDIPILVTNLLRRINEELHTKVFKVSSQAMERIQKHDWSGNVRELENVLTRAVVLSKSDVIEESVLPNPSEHLGHANHYDWNRSLADVEREHIRRVLDAVHGNRTEAARILGISKPTLYAKLPTVKHEEKVDHHETAHSA
ncbi:MAG: sigma-54 dependent transcriptional regulator [Bacteroidota bacterium]|nr:sigma-54 dependent transcriptional regulator [Bacteroidota bacterium]MDP4232423.1 sigma-54 dependent transcriptional regulator [Bacteroidota bacterium]MDP4241559.1 sigma-54 dependent transcriptional regulator [Bacteroidota bacterium]MDP4286303.1 sigma-54 dependent transcriptional regulator [Bacteroidota bacterium]